MFADMSKGEGEDSRSQHIGGESGKGQIEERIVAERTLSLSPTPFFLISGLSVMRAGEPASVCVTASAHKGANLMRFMTPHFFWIDRLGRSRGECLSGETNLDALCPFSPPLYKVNIVPSGEGSRKLGVAAAGKDARRSGFSSNL